jgi:hypothetical protein
MERRIAMRQVIKRFLKHLDAEKNASGTTIESYRYDLRKFDLYLVNGWVTDFFQEMFLAITYGIISFGFQKSVIKNQTVPRLVRGPWQPYGRFSSMLIEQGC